MEKKFLQSEAKVFEREAERVIKKVNSELSSIPQYKSAPEGMPNPAEATVRGLTNTIQAIRRGMRLLRGGQSTSQLIAKRQKMEDLLDDVNDLRTMGFNIGGKDGMKLGSLTGKLDERAEMSSMTPSEYLKRKAKRRMENRK
tara:strand:+ start:515 stop:940 length:426 start_codon:yes stop_codon:yes gene_type:complete